MLGNDSDKTALVEGHEKTSYAALKARSGRLATGLLDGKQDLREERIAFLIPASLDYVTVLHGIWQAGGIAIPLNVASAAAELEHYLGSTGVTRLIANDPFQEPVRALCEELGIQLLSVGEALADNCAMLPAIDNDRRALILFTSGTTSKPKGVVLTHRNLRAQIASLVEAWQWTDGDVIPLFLPLHHIHGIVNVLSCALWCGATVHLFPKLDIPLVCDEVASGTYNVFMAVPTIYVKLIDYLASTDAARATSIRDGFSRMRLNVSGSAACPVKVFNQWRELTNQVLLERYGMTEIGMGLSNPYHGERRAGHVGMPLPGVSIRLCDEDGSAIDEDERPGEIRIKGDTVFGEYWNNPDATSESFKDGWFCSGDIAVLDDGYFRIMGRSSVDIIKSGGYKLSALEIEGVLLTHDDIREVAVVGIDDDTWGEIVVAAVSLRDGSQLTLPDLKQWCAGRMSAYKVPKRLEVLESLPRNAMGKVTKPALKAQL